MDLPEGPPESLPINKITPPNDLVPVLSPIIGNEATTERKPFSIVGSTIVAEPEFIHLISKAEGDGMGTKENDVKQVLEDIAQGKASIDTLRTLADKYASEKKKYPHKVYDNLAAADRASAFLARAIYLDSQRRRIPFPGVWVKVVILNGQPYAICALNKPQNDWFETGIVKKGNTTIPRYSGGVLDGNNAIALCEDDIHAQLGTFPYRLAAIIDFSRTEAFEDIIQNPEAIEVGIQPDANFPEGRLYTILKRKKFAIPAEKD